MFLGLGLIFALSTIVRRVLGARARLRDPLTRGTRFYWGHVLPALVGAGAAPRWGWPTAGWSRLGSTQSCRSGSRPWWLGCPPSRVGELDGFDLGRWPSSETQAMTRPNTRPLGLRDDHRDLADPLPRAQVHLPGRRSYPPTPDARRGRSAAGLGDHPGQGRGGHAGRLPGVGLRRRIPAGNPGGRRPEHRPDRRDRPGVRRASSRSGSSPTIIFPPDGPARPTSCTAADQSRGEWFWFLDADTGHAPENLGVDDGVRPGPPGRAGQPAARAAVRDVLGTDRPAPGRRSC